MEGGRKRGEEKDMENGRELEGEGSRERDMDGERDKKIDEGRGRRERHRENLLLFSPSWSPAYRTVLPTVPRSRSVLPLS